MSGTQTVAHAFRNLDELRRLSHIEGTIRRKPRLDHVDNPARPWAHDYDFRRQKHSLGDRVRHENHGLAGSLPKLQKLLVQMIAQDLIESPEWLIHQKDFRIERK